MTTLDPTKNFAIAQAVMGYDDKALIVTLTSGAGVKFPNPSVEGAFNLVWWDFTSYPSPADDPNVEIVRCMSRIGDVLTIVRAQEATGATVKNSLGHTYLFMHGPTAKTITDIKTKIDETGILSIAYAVAL